MTEPTTTPRITSPRSAGGYLLQTPREGFGLLCLDARGYLLADEPLRTVQEPGDIVPRELYRRAIRAGSASVLVWRRTTQKYGSPSDADLTACAWLKTVGDSLGIHLADYLILGDEAYHSVRAAQG